MNLSRSTAVKRIIGAPVLAAALAVVGTAVPAFASAYYSAASPLRAMQDGVSQAEMFGAFSIKNLSYAHNAYSYRDPRPGGDAVYVETFYNWYRNSSFVSGVGTDTSPKYSQAAWTGSADQQQLYASGNAVRILTNVCEDHGPLKKDPCSIRPTEYFNY